MLTNDWKYKVEIKTSIGKARKISNNRTGILQGYECGNKL